MSKLNKLIPNQQVHAQEMQDPDVRAHWERTALARAVAIAICQYRANNDLTQAELAQQIGWSQSSVARLEDGEHNPTIETLARLSTRLGLYFQVNIYPSQDTSPQNKQSYQTSEELAGGSAQTAIRIDN